MDCSENRNKSASFGLLQYITGLFHSLSDTSDFQLAIQKMEFKRSVYKRTD